MPDCCDNVGSSGKWVKMLNPLTSLRIFALGFQPAHPLQIRAVHVHPFRASAAHTPLPPIFLCPAACWESAAGMSMSTGLGGKMRREQQLGQTELCCCVGTEVRAWGGADARLGSAAASSQLSGWGTWASPWRGRENIPASSRGGASCSLDVHLGDFFLLSAFNAILSSSGAILKCLKIEQSLSVSPFFHFPSSGEQSAGCVCFSGSAMLDRWEEWGWGVFLPGHCFVYQISVLLCQLL